MSIPEYPQHYTASVHYNIFSELESLEQFRFKCLDRLDALERDVKHLNKSIHLIENEIKSLRESIHNLK